jgi:O-antigen/teichoic acid export membrane protein
MTKVYKNIFYNLVGQLLLILLSFIGIKYIYKELGKDVLGIIYFNTSLNFLVRVAFDAGICHTTVKEISANFKSNIDYVKKVIGTFSFLFWCSYLIVAISVFNAAPIIVTHWLNLSSIDTGDAVIMLRILTVSSMLALPNSLYSAIFRGMQRMEFMNLIEVLASGIQQIGIIFILATSGKLMLVISWIACSYILKTLIYHFTLLQFFPPSALMPRLFVQVLKNNRQFASQMFSISAISAIQIQLDKLIISKLLPIGLLGIYSVSFGYVTKGNMLSNSFGQAIYPSFSELFYSGKINQLKREYGRIQELICYLTIPVFAGMCMLSHPLYSFILDKNAANMLFLPTIFLCVGYYMNGTMRAPFVLSFAMGMPGIVALFNIFSLLAMVPITILLIYILGLNGAAFSWVVYNLFAYFFAIPKIFQKCLEISSLDWYRFILKVFIIISVTYGVGCIFLIITIKNYSIWTLLSVYLISSIAFIVVSYNYVSNDLRNLFEDIINY